MTGIICRETHPLTVANHFSLCIVRKVCELELELKIFDVTLEIWSMSENPTKKNLPRRRIM